MLLDRIGKELIFFDGGMGTLLQDRGLKPGELPETWNVLHPERIREIHSQYVTSGSQLILANTFGANGLKFHHHECTLDQVIEQGICIAKEAKAPYVGLDVGPTGKLLKPLGDLSFDDAYQTFAEMMRIGARAGADFIHIETMSDSYELKAAVLAAKEQTNLPVFATVIFDEKGKLLTGGDVPAVVALLEGLGVDALGINCGLGPEQMLPILEELVSYASIPIIVKPNAGLPKQKDGQTYYDVSAEEFAETMQKVVSVGAHIIGGCCGTTPDHISSMVEHTKGLELKPIKEKCHTLVSSFGKAVEIGKNPIIIGERINPTGKKKLKEALKNKDMEYLLREAVTQQDKGAHILDVNVGLPDIDEVEMMTTAIREIQSVTSLPLQIDTVNMDALEVAMRQYNGKPMVNSVNGKKESMDAVFPLIKKYGGVVVGLTLDEDGIPKTVEGRMNIANKIIKEAATYGIAKKDIVIDALAMTISSEPTGAITTLETVKRVTEELGVCTVLGVSNISFGLPNRPIINANFYTMAMQNGLSAAIINPSSDAMMKSYYAYCALMGLDDNCEAYIGNYTNYVEGTPQNTAASMVKKESGSEKNLRRSIERGLKEEAYEETLQLVKTQEPLEIINTYLIPALDTVGKGFEKGTLFLPQLLMSAEAAKKAFQVLKEELDARGVQQEKKEKIVLATVKGDIHDIGKNIVKVLLENYSFDVIDLGKDVAPELIVETAIKEDVRLVGLSALMTTTVVSMEETIALLKEKKPDCKVMVGGAVLNQEYADMIGAHFYGRDAMQSVYFAQEYFQK